MSYWISHRNIIKWAMMAAAGLLATRLFFVQEMMAALLIFSVAFACVAVVALFVFVVDHAVLTALGGVDILAKAFGRVARRSWERAEGYALRMLF
jgi:hypothetical protein